MKVVLVSDIFGKTPALLKMANDLNADRIIDPYKGETMGFETEIQAYDYFMDQVGIEQYLALLQEHIDFTEEPVSLVGFSVGASVIWRLSETETAKNVCRGFCFYGSQIRHAIDVQPRFDIELILPRYESHFDVATLLSQLKAKRQVIASQVDYLHGFMNPHSENYDELGYQQQIHRLCSILR